MKRRVTLGCVISAALLIGAGCGSDDASLSENTDNPSGGSQGSETSNVPSAPDPNGVDDAADVVDAALGEDCGQWLAIWSGMVGSAFSGELTAEQQADFDKLKDDVPPEIADDIAVYEKFFDTIASEGFLAAAEMAASPELEEAGDNITAYLQENCDTGN